MAVGMTTKFAWAPPANSIKRLTISGPSLPPPTMTSAPFDGPADAEAETLPPAHSRGMAIIRRMNTVKKYFALVLFMSPSGPQKLRSRIPHGDTLAKPLKLGVRIAD